MLYNIYYEQFSHLESNLHFLNRYLKLIIKFKERNLRKAKGLDNHHIFPRSFGGSNRKENMVYLSFKEHFIIHHLLWKAFPGNKKMVYAFNMMVNHKTGKITSKVFEKIKLEHQILQSERMTNNPLSKESNKKSGDSRRGTIWIHRGQENKLVKKEDFENVYKPLGWKSGKFQKAIFSEKSRQNISDAKKETIWIHKDNEQKLVKKEDAELFYFPSGWLTGKFDVYYHSKETLKKMSDSHKGKPQSPESIKKRSDSTRGKIYITNGEIKLFVTLEEASILYEYGFLLGRKL